MAVNAKALFRARLKGRIGVNRKNERKMNTDKTTKNALTETKPLLGTQSSLLNEEIVKSKLKCPKCKSTDLLIQEMWTGHFIEWDQTKGIFDRNDGILGPGSPSSVWGKCKKCKH